MIKEDCSLCVPSEKYQHLHIKDFEFWSVNLFDNQYYLGRCLIPLKRHAEDIFIDTSVEEKKELTDIVKRLGAVSQKLFGAEMFNYAAFGNEVNHAHLHFIPRYKKPVTFQGITFTDERWGQNYAPYNKEFVIPKSAQLKIVEVLKSEL